MTLIEEPGVRQARDATPASGTRTDETPWGLQSPMRVRKRNGGLEPIDLNKIVRAVGRAARGLDGVDPMRVATRTISGLHDGATTMELDELSIRTAAALAVSRSAVRRRRSAASGTTRCGMLTERSPADGPDVVVGQPTPV